MKPNWFLITAVVLSGFFGGVLAAGDLCPQPPDPPLFCPPPTDACHGFGVCDPETGQCVYPPLPDGTGCDDGNTCSGPDSCQSGVCTGGPPTGGPCSDGDFCTMNDMCVGTTCSGTPQTCNDGNACTDDFCNPLFGCSALPNSGGPCDDNDVCTTQDQCSNGSCQGGPPLDCDDENGCTTDFCFGGMGCSHSGNPGQTCDDGTACTAGDTCDPNTGTTCNGTLEDCDDGNSCTADACNPETGCSSTPNPNQPCSDDNACTSGDICDASGTTCIGGSAVTCTPLDVCHVAGTCDPQSGCSNPTVPDGTSCADRDVCNGEEACLAGVCRSAYGPSCDDDNPCTTDTCDEGSGCSNLVVDDGTECDDLDACDGLELCEAGTCTPGTPLVCEDTSVCTDDLCFPIKRESRSYDEVTAATEENVDNPHLLVSPAGGLLVYLVSHLENYNDPDQGPHPVLIHVLKFAVDEERVAWIVENGSPRAILPGETFELTRTVPEGGGPRLAVAAFTQEAGAADLGNGLTRVVVPFEIYEGGCSFVNQTGDCQLPDGAVYDLNGDSDPFDSMLAYSEIVIDRVTRTILSIENVVTDTESASFIAATNGWKIAHVNPESGDADCEFTAQHLNCQGGYRIDRNGDGVYSPVLSLHDVSTGGTAHTLLKVGSDVYEISLEMGGDLLAFESHEIFSSVDYNEDGDEQDVALRYTSAEALYDRPTLTPGTGPVLSFVDLAGVEGTLVTYVHLGKLRLFDTVTRGDVSTESPVDGSAGPNAFELEGGIEAHSTHEGQDPPAVEYNDDGDFDDRQLRFYEHATRTIVTTDITLFDWDEGPPTHNRIDGTSDGEIIAYAYAPYGAMPPVTVEIRYIRVAPCAGAPCGEEGEHCVHPDVFNGMSCADGEACNGNETCQSGVCAAGNPVVCNDGNPCTSDVCQDGSCPYPPQAGSCDDLNACTGPDQCTFGFCSGSQISAPSETQGVRMPDPFMLTWDATPSATSYEVLRGALAALPVGPGGADESCFEAFGSTSLLDPFVPGPETGVWYLVRASNACDTGPYGTQSNGTPRVSTTCP